MRLTPSADFDDRQMDDLDPWRLPLQPAPQRVIAAAAAPLRSADFPPITQAQAVLGGALPPADAVLRAPDGRVLVTCTTDFPGATPAMLDWWFGWHLPSSARYRLWHPAAHVASRVQEDRSRLAGDPAAYVGNASHVDEYIGRRLMRLTIAFVPPADYGLRGLKEAGATAICARTRDRLLKGEGGGLLHLVLPAQGGAQMRSGFWLGEVRHEFALVDALLHGVLNSARMRRLLVADRFARDLLLHCGEEMNHLARFLPGLYAERGPDAAAA